LTAVPPSIVCLHGPLLLQCTGLFLAQSPRRCFTARQECFESRHFEVKRNGDVLWAVSCLVAFDGGVGPPMPSASTLSTALMVTWRTSGDCVPGALRDHSISFYFWIGVRADVRAVMAPPHPSDWQSAARTAPRSARVFARDRSRLSRPRRAFDRPPPRPEAPSSRWASAVRVTFAERVRVPRSG